MSSSTGAAGRAATHPAALPGTRVLLAAALAATIALLPDHPLDGWVVFGPAAVIAVFVGVWIHPRANQAVLWWAAAAPVCMLAAQVCALVGGTPARSGGGALIDLFLFAAGIAASGALLSAIARRVPGWDAGFLLDLIIVVAGVALVVWQYGIDPFIVPGVQSTLLHLTLAAYPTLCLVLAMLAAMMLVRVGWRGRGVVLMSVAVVGVVFSNLCLLAARIDDGAAAGFWRNAAWAGIGWLVFQGCWALATLHMPDARCPSAEGRWPRRPISLTRLLLLVGVALVDPVAVDVQTATGGLTPFAHFPIVGLVVFVAVLVRLSFIGAEHLKSMRRLSILLDSQQAISGADSAAALAKAAADAAASLLEGRGEACVALSAAAADDDRLTTAVCETEPDRAEPQFDSAWWNRLIGGWPAHAGARPVFLTSEQIALSDEARPSTVLACPVTAARPRHDGEPPLGMILAIGECKAVTGAADVLALLAGQVAQSVDRIGMIARMAQRHLKAMTANIADAILVVDEERVVRYSNAAAAVLFGETVQAGSALSEVVGRSHADSLSARAEAGPLRWTLPGGLRVVEAVVDDRRADPTVEGFVVTLRDVTKLHTLELEMRRRSTHDQETGLENRVAFTARLARAEERADAECGVLAVAIDDLPQITDEFGADAAGRVVEAMARRLAGAFDREQPAVARIDASTLALLISGAPELPTPDVLLVRVRTAGHEPVVFADRAVTVSLSGGIAVRRRGHPAAEVLEDALSALHAAQRNSPRGLAVFTPELRETSREQADMRAGLNDALIDGAFSIHYQPVVNLDDRRPVSAEALIRWRKPDGTLVRPDVFIPFAEQTGQIVPLGDWVLRRAIEDYRRWPQTENALSPEHLRVNINVSPVQLREPDFVTQLRALLAETRVPPASLVLEVTETGIVEQVEILVQVRALGIGVAMDDFGTGYSSLSSLRRLPISTVKIDKAFVDNIATDPLQYALVEGIVRLAGELGLTTVAEGVENEDQHARLRETGCTCGQGFLYSPPLPAAEYEQWLRSAGAQ